MKKIANGIAVLCIVIYDIYDQQGRCKFLSPEITLMAGNGPATENPEVYRSYS